MPITKRLFCALLLSTVAASGHAQSALDRVLKDKTLRVAIPTDFPPYGFVGTDLAPQGLDIDMGRLIAEHLGVQVELLQVRT